MSEIEHIKLILSAAKALEQEVKKLTITEGDVRSFAEVNRHLRDIKKTCYHAIGEQKMGSGTVRLQDKRIAKNQNASTRPEIQQCPWPPMSPVSEK